MYEIVAVSLCVSLRAMLLLSQIAATLNDCFASKANADFLSFAEILPDTLLPRLLNALYENSGIFTRFLPRRP